MVCNWSLFINTHPQTFWTVFRPSFQWHSKFDTQRRLQQKKTQCHLAKILNLASISQCEVIQQCQYVYVQVPGRLLCYMSKVNLLFTGRLEDKNYHLDTSYCVFYALCSFWYVISLHGSRIDYSIWPFWIVCHHLTEATRPHQHSPLQLCFQCQSAPS